MTPQDCANSLAAEDLATKTPLQLVAEAYAAGRADALKEAPISFLGLTIVIIQTIRRVNLCPSNEEQARATRPLKTFAQVMAN